MHYRALVFMVSMLAATVVPGRAADSLPGTIVRNAYATYIRNGSLTIKNVATLKPYLERGLYALLVRWLSQPKHAWTLAQECSFDADPFFATQAGPGSLPITLGVGTNVAGHAAVPVSIPSNIGGTAPRMISHTLVEFAGTGADVRIFDIVPVLDSKPYPGSSMRASLSKYSKDARCHR